MTCCGIGHKQIGNCRDQSSKYVICAGPHKVEKHCYRVAGCNKRKRKICVHVTIKCANYGETHTTNSPRCISRHKADIKARKEKKMKEKSGEEKVQAYSANDKVEDERREKSLLVDIEIDLKDER